VTAIGRGFTATLSSHMRGPMLTRRATTWKEAIAAARRRTRLGEVEAADEREAVSGDTPVRRYLSLSAVIATIKTGRLRFTRVDKFQDPFEGSWASSSICCARWFPERRLSATFLNTGSEHPRR
jgi:hypothetical protein